MSTPEKALVTACGSVLAAIIVIVPLAGRGAFGPVFPKTAMAIGAVATLGLLMILLFFANRSGGVRGPLLAMGLGIAVLVAAITVALAASISAAF